jgi:tetratricopeptide (TPR) repeat protein
MPSAEHDNLEARLAALASDRDIRGAHPKISELLEEASKQGENRVAARAALWLAEFETSMCEYELAVQMCARAEQELEGIDAPVERARLVLARAYALVDTAPDEELLKDALPTLEHHGHWSHASSAAALVANALTARGANALARHFYLLAIGAAEAAGLQLRGPALLRSLADLEMRDGRPVEAEQLLLIALRRLRPVLMLQARLEEARCIEWLGDAVRAQNRIDQARSFYDDALERLANLQAGGSDRVREKIAALS